MENYIQEFKNRAHAKDLTSADMLARAFVKAIKAKSENKMEIATYFARKAFTPRKTGTFEGFYDAQRSLKWLTKSSRLFKDGQWVEQPRKLMGIPFEEIFTAEEVELFDKMMNEVKLNANNI